MRCAFALAERLWGMNLSHRLRYHVVVYAKQGFSLDPQMDVQFNLRMGPNTYLIPTRPLSWCPHRERPLGRAAKAGGMWLVLSLSLLLIIGRAISSQPSLSIHLPAALGVIWQWGESRPR